MNLSTAEGWTPPGYLDITFSQNLGQFGGFSFKYNYFRKHKWKNKVVILYSFS